MPALCPWLPVLLALAAAPSEPDWPLLEDDTLGRLEEEPLLGDELGEGRLVEDELLGDELGEGRLAELLELLLVLELDGSDDVGMLLDELLWLLWGFD